LNENTFEKLVEKDYKIFVDTSSLMQKDSENVFFRVIAPILYKHKKRLIVPKSVLNEISKHNYTNHPNIKLANNILNELGKYNLYGINSKFDEEFADNAITSQFHSLRLKYNLCLITNDNSYKKDGNLSQDILDLKKSRSSDGIKDIRVFFIKDNNLKEFMDNTQVKNFNKKKIFRLPTQPNKNDTQLNPKEIPTIGSIVTDNQGKKHKLLKQIGRTGGEGSVYLTNTNYICKIYKQEKVTLFRKEKIKRLITNNIKVKNICLPEFIVYNNRKEFVGYIMSQADGHEIKTSIFIPPLFKQKFPHWNRLHLAKVAFNILKKVEELHSYNIILGDINPSNILIKDENNIFFIDTDSFQIEEYPCSVGMVAYTKKERHGQRYENYLRDKDDDIFAVSVLVFQLMLPGKLPYSFSGGGSEKENMNPKNFPYKCYDGDGYTNAPDGQWIYIWSNLPRNLKLLFCKIFKKSEKILINELIKEMQNYIYQLNKGFQSTEVFPLTHKQINEEGKVLKNDFKELNCACGRKFAIPNKKVEEFKIKGWKLPTKCEVCRKIKDPDLKKCTKCNKQFKDKHNNLCQNCRGKNISCSSCYKTFFFSDGEKKFYDKKNLSYPKKCEECRNNKSNSNNTKAQPNISLGSILGSIFKW